MRNRVLFPGPSSNCTISLMVICATIAMGLLGCTGAIAQSRTGEPQESSRTGSQSPRLDCPLLPGCPNGPTVPLPPSTEPAPRKHTEDSVDGSGLAEGTGKYAGMVYVQAGPFNIGSPDGQGRPDEQPKHRVILKAFYIGKHEVTTKQYCQFLNAKGAKSRDGMPRVLFDSPVCPIQKDGRYFRPKRGEADRPMICVSWYGATDYAEWAGGRLPTSAEWEKAAALCTPYRPPDFLTVLPRQGRAPVSIASPGLKGITGMIGNVWEWCSDWYDKDYYSKSPTNNPPGPALGKEKIIRGGSWASPEASKRIQNLHKAAPMGYYRTVGFRIVKD